MKRKTIVITQFDKDRIEELIAVAQHRGDQRDRNDLNELQAELEHAKVVAPSDIPADIITMNSTSVLRDMDTDETVTFSLVFPEDADIEKGAISVLAPIGTAMLGYRVGATIEWPVPDGRRRFCIEEIVYQPEAAGDLDR